MIHPIASWILKKRIKRFQRAVENPIETQKRVWSSLVTRARNTEFGKKHGFDSISSQSEFKSRIPLRTYEEFYPFISKAQKGIPDVLWPGKTEWFSKSSGTTNDKSKYIPVTKESLRTCHYKAGRDMLTLYLHNRAESELFSGKSLSMGGSHQISFGHNDIRQGDISAILIENLPAFFEFVRVPSKEVALMTDWEEKIKKIASSFFEKKITSITGVPSWTLVMLKELYNQCEKRGVDPNEVLNHLEVFFHGGVSMTPYWTQFKRLIPNTGMKYFETYNASEGFFGVQYSLESSDLVLLIDHGVYYEFCPINHLNEEADKVVGLDEVKPGVVYSVIISTNGGLWRYRLGDTIIFTSCFPFLFKIVGRTQHFINVFGEELMVGNAEEALKKCCIELNLVLNDYTAAPVIIEEGIMGYHEWAIEFERTPDSEEAFANLLDKSLKELNSDYEAKRYQNMILQMPKVHFVKPGTFSSWMKKRNKLGGQNKVPRLFHERKYLEEILNQL